MPLNAVRLIRKMRGGAQAHLLECDDGCFYVVKFLNNPQHRRILINEHISSLFLQFLDISVPKTAVVNASREFLADNPEIYLQLGHRRQPIEPGWHFGSCYPGDPARVTVYDFLPDVLLDKVENLKEFCGVLAFDKWMGNADARQAIFFRARLKPLLNRGSPATSDEPDRRSADEKVRRSASEHVPRSASEPARRSASEPARRSADEPARRSADPARMGFVAEMMDHGYVFDGPGWSFGDSPLQGLYFRPQVYRQVRSFDDFQPWLDRIMHFPEQIVDQTLRQIPSQWLAGDEAELEKLLTKLLARSKRVPDLIREAQHGRVNPFPHWV